MVSGLMKSTTSPLVLVCHSLGKGSSRRTWEARFPILSVSELQLTLKLLCLLQDSDGHFLVSCSIDFEGKRTGHIGGKAGPGKRMQPHGCLSPSTAMQPWGLESTVKTGVGEVVRN
ncbi:hypothetical protein MLD38_009891 [Melastoma candidum]|uniref:Uncharacterized protein n=1 Tax=Melastoma candidum TaxID=119954 RepID=A0ACB9RZI7_9MYRT|nr:hypothetical protein MLD38_009891 [Melastoma candidum]